MSLDEQITRAVRDTLKESLPVIVADILSQSSSRKTLTLEDVQERLKIGNSTLHELRRNASAGFPKPMMTTPHRLIWWEDEIDAWLDSRRKPY